MNKRKIYLFLTFIFIAFIYANSLKDAPQSSGDSMFFVEIINNLLHSLNFDISISEHFVRKLAHFTEYFVLGYLLYKDVILYNKSIYIAFICGLIIPATDELLQFIPVGRSPMFSDVILDFSGVVCSVLIFNFISGRRIKNV